MLRITAGEYSRRKVSCLDSIRATKSVVREAIFNIICARYSDILDGGKVLDLFGGTGILSYEALSRGASSAIINEINARHIAVARQNAEKIGVLDKVSFARGDALFYEGGYRGVDIVFIDPPFGKNYGIFTVENVLRNKRGRTLIVLELCKEEMLRFDHAYPNSGDARRYGRSYVKIMCV